jgi:hypothetical protein
MSSSFPMMTASSKTRAWHSADLSNHDQLKKLLETYHKVHLPKSISSDIYGDVLTWCLEHSQGKFRDLKEGDGMDWYFEIEQDATMFALKWS